MSKASQKIWLHFDEGYEDYWYEATWHDEPIDEVDIEYILKSEADRAHRILADRLKEVRAQCDNLQAENDRLLNAVKLAYRKHHLDDRSVGWEELSDALFNTLCDAMGDIGFDEWLKKQRKGC